MEDWRVAASKPFGVRNVNKTIAGPSLRALAAAAVGRNLIQLDHGPGCADYSRSGALREEVKDVTVLTYNIITVAPPDVQSRLTWEFNHPRWALSFVERRELDTDGTFVKSGPHQVWLEGDLVEAARFLGIAKELFVDAVRADGWSHSDIMIGKMRWPNIPLLQEMQSLREVMLAL